MTGRRRPQLRIRVLAAVLTITIVAFAAFDIAAVAALRGYMLARTDATLRAVLSLSRLRLDRLLPRAESGDQPVRLQRILGAYYVAFVSDRGSTVILEADPEIAPRLPGDLATIAADQRAQTVTGRNGQGEFRLRAARAAGGTLVVSVNLDGVDSTVLRLELIVGVGSAAAVVLITLGVALVLSRGLRPLETMAVQADRITAGQLTERVDTREAGGEIGRLGEALNGMLARIEGSVRERDANQDLMRRFFADASHELRTPLASLRANAELYQQGALPRREQVDEAMRRILLEAQRLSRLVDDMLRLARLDQHPAPQRARVDLTTVVDGCLERARIADPGRTWRGHVAPGLHTVGDEELLRRAVDNLLANVRTHTPEGTIAAVTAAGRGASIVLEVGDDGPGVPDERIPHLFERFYRAGAQGHPPGSGLGLAIVREIVTAHGGEAEAASNRPRGLRIIVTLPASAETAAPRRAPGSPAAP